MLVARELVMLVLTQVALRRGMDLEVNMVGRWAVWPTMFSMFLAMVSVTWVAEALLYVGPRDDALGHRALLPRRFPAPSGRESSTLKRSLTVGRILACHPPGAPRPHLPERIRWTRFPTLAHFPTRS